MSIPTQQAKAHTHHLSFYPLPSPIATFLPARATTEKKMMKRCSSISSPLAAVVLLLLLACFFHGAAAARLLPTVHPLVHQENGVKDAAVDELPVLQNGAAVIGDDLSVSEMMGAEAEEAACEENDDECLQRRLLRDAHLDYIYTQHKGGKQP